MQDRPVCFVCPHPVEHSPVYEAPCGHDRCSSVVFHALCLFEWREHRETHKRRFGEVIAILFDRRQR